MSLPLTRRIAKTVLLTAAGAASVVGTAGAANAAELPTTADVGGLSTLDQGVAAATESAKALAPKSSTAPMAPAAETAPAPADPAMSTLPETGFTFESSTPQAGLSVQSNNGGLAQEVGKVTGSVTQGRMPQLPDAQNAMPEVHTKGLPTDSVAPQGKPSPSDPKQQAPQQSPAQQPAQNPQDPAANAMDPQMQGPLSGLVGMSGVGETLTKGLGTLNLG